MSAGPPEADGELVVAFFDLDRTLVDGYGYTRLMKRLWRARVRRPGLAWLIARVALSRLTPRTALSSWWPAAFARYLKGLSADDLAEVARAAAADVQRDLRPALREVLAQERARGAELWLVTATVDLLAEAVAGRLGFEECLCTALERQGSLWTGRLAGSVCRGPEKAERARAEAARRGAALDWPRCGYYADGYEDLPLLEAVGRPCAVHPDPRLLDVAKARGYQCLGAPRRHRSGG